MRNSLNRKHNVKAVVISLAVLISLILIVVGIDIWEKHEAKKNYVDPLIETAEMREENQNIVRYEGKWYKENKSLETFLLFGVDKFEHDIEGTDSGFVNQQQADFFLLLVVDEDNKTVTPMMLNRDTMTEITTLAVTGEEATHYTAQLALAHTYGSGGKDSCRNTVKAVSTLLYGVEIDHYIALTMDVVPVVNDLVGGVPVEIRDDFSAVDLTLVQGESLVLKGNQALTFVRSRGNVGDQTNISRMQRQTEYLDAFIKKLNESAAKDETFSLKLAMAIGDFMVSDFTTNQLSDVANQFADYTHKDFISVAGEAVKGSQYMEFYPDTELLQQTVIDTFFQIQEEQ